MVSEDDAVWFTWHERKSGDGVHARDGYSWGWRPLQYVLRFTGGSFREMLES